MQNNTGFKLNQKDTSFREEEFVDQLNIALLADPHMSYLDHPLSVYSSLFDDIYNDSINFNKLNFWVACGDEATTHDNCTEGWHRVQNRYYRHVPTSLLLTQGNHDVYSYNGGGGYPLGWASRPYDNNLWISLNETNNIRVTHAIYQQGILFLFLGDKGEHRLLPYGQKVWLEHLTGLYPNTTTVIFSHEGQRDDNHTWPTAGSYGFYNDVEWWRDFFKRNPQIELWVNGHGHCYNMPHNKHTVYYNNDPLTFILVPGFQNNSQDKIGYLNINESEMRFRFWDVSSNCFTDDWQITTYTTFNGYEKGWISFPMFLEDNESQWFDNKILSADVTLQLVGWHDREMFGNPNLTWFDQCMDYDWLYFGNDLEEQVRQWNGETIPQSQDGEPCGVLSIDTGGNITFPHKNAVGYAPWDTYTQNIMQGGNCYSHIGCSYEMFGQQPPGAKYDVSITIKTDNKIGHVKVIMNCSEENDIYTIIEDSEKIVIDTNVNSTYWTYKGTFTISNENISIINGKIVCEESYDVDWYNITNISIMRNASGSETKDFHLRLGNTWFNSTKILLDCECINYSVDALKLMNESVVDVFANIGGNKKGFARLIYKTPVLMARNGRFKLNSYNGDNKLYNITITDQLSINNDYFYLTPLIYDYGNLAVSKGSVISTNNNNTFSKTLINSSTFEVIYGPLSTSQYEPSNPYPEDEAIDVDIYTDLIWDIEEVGKNNILSFDVYFGNNADPPLVSEGQIEKIYDPNKMDYSTKYYWKIVVWDNYENSYEGSIWSFTTEENDPPCLPIITGPNKLKPNLEGIFTVKANDPKNDMIYFYIDWGDGGIVNWEGPHNSGEYIEYKHSWNESGSYKIRVKAKDQFDLESNWTEYDIRISNPRNVISYWLKFIERLYILRILFIRWIYP